MSTYFLSVTLLVVVILTTMLLSLIFARVFQRSQTPKSSPVCTNNDILKALTKGSDLEVKKAIADPRIKVSVIQMQDLGLTREERRRRNRKLVLSLADSQAESFIALKKRISKETCMKIIEDFCHRPCCMNSLQDAKEDLVTFIKKKYGNAVSCTCNSCAECCGNCYNGQACSCSDDNEGGIILYIFKVV